MQTTTITEAPYETISVGEAKVHLRIFVSDFDRELEGVIASAVDWCERETGRTLRTAVTHVSRARCWSELQGSLPWQPVLAITHLKYLDEDGVERTVDVAHYRLLASADAAAVLEFDGEYDLPTVAARSDAIRLTWTSGYANLDKLPPLAKHMVKVACKLFWGDLDAGEIEKWEACARRIMGLIDWGRA